MLRLLLLMIIGVLIYRALKSRPERNVREQDQSAGRATGMTDDEMIQDPVCGVYFPRREAVTLDSAGRQLCFCSAACRDHYLEQQTDNS